MVFWVLVAIAVFGGILAVLGLRGRLVGSTPRCRGCGFDLSGRAPMSERCPECGGSLSGAGVVVGTRRRRWRIAAAGIFLLLIGGGAASFVVWGHATSFDWNTVKPVWMLRNELESRDPQTSDGATTELLKRLRAGRLSESLVVDVSLSILAIQGDRSRTWDPRLGDWIETAWSNGSQHESLFRRYLRQAPGFAISGRPWVEQGADWWRFQLIESGGRAGTQNTLRIAQRPKSAAMGTRPLRSLYAGSSEGMFHTGSGRSWMEGSLDMRNPGDPPLDLGRQEILYELEVTMSYPSTQCGETFVVPLRTSVEVVEDGADPIDLLTADETGAPSPGVLTSVSPAWAMRSIPQTMIQGWVRAEALTVPLAMEVYWRSATDPARQILIGTLTMRPSERRQLVQYAGSVHEEVPTGEYIVVLRPSVQAAKNTVDLTRIWGGEIELGRVEVRESTGSIPYPAE